MKTSFNITQETTVTNQTVKVTANVTARIDGTNVTNENLGPKVRATLDQFVKGDWVFANPVRNRDKFNVETATFTALVRVSMSENHSLFTRAEEASTDYIIIDGVAVDTSVPTNDVQEATSRLRADMLKRAVEEANRLGEALQVSMRVKRIRFDDEAAALISNAKGLTMRTQASAYAAPNSDGDGGLGHSAKISLVARVTVEGS